MKKSVVLLLVLVLGLALIAGLRLAVPSMFVVDDAAVSAPVYHATSPGAGGASIASSTELDSTSSDAFDALLYATATQQSSGFSENADDIDLALQSGASQTHYDTEPNGAGQTSNSFGSGAGNNGSSIGYPPRATGSEQFPFGIGFGSGGFPSAGATSTHAFANAATPSPGAVDDLGTLVDLPSDMPHSELPGASGTIVADLQTAASASAVPILEPPSWMLLFFALGLLWVTQARRLRATSKNDRSK
ncbi:MAG: hypothetical protein ACXWCY_22305 [Burkholderiales bacterium]